MDVVYAKSNVMVDGRLIRAGSHWPADDPLVLGHPDLFSGDPSHGLNFTVVPQSRPEPPVEGATRAPGERRTTRRG